MPDASPRTTWSKVRAAAALPSEHAAVISARRKYRHWAEPPYAAMLGHYTRALEVFASLDNLRLSSVEVTDLIRVVDAATAGLPGDAVHAPSRARLTRARLVTLDGGQLPGRCDPADPTVTVRATIAGIAVARAASPANLVLSPPEIECLARLAMDGGCPSWPGSVQAHYVTAFWKLTVNDRGRFRLTRLGKEVLAASRDRFVDQIVPTGGQAKILDSCAAAGARGSSLLDFTRTSVRGVATRGWIARVGASGPVPRYRLTQTGRDALDRHHAATIGENGEPIPAPITASQLQEGMRVRIINRDGLGVGREYARVLRTEKVTTGGRGQVGWQVWVADAEGRPFIYGGRAFHPATRYEIDPVP